MAKVYEKEMDYDTYARLRFKVEVLLAHHYTEEEIVNELDVHPLIVKGILYDMELGYDLA